MTPEVIAAICGVVLAMFEARSRIGTAAIEQRLALVEYRLTEMEKD